MGVRFLKNIILKVDYQGIKEDVPFASGEIVNAPLVEDDGEYSDIHLYDGSIIHEVSNTVFGIIGTKTNHVVKKPDVLPNEDIVHDPVILDGSIFNNTWDEDDGKDIS
jgi:hypothetical protein